MQQPRSGRQNWLLQRVQHKADGWGTVVLLHEVIKRQILYATEAQTEVFQNHIALI